MPRTLKMLLVQKHEDISRVRRLSIEDVYQGLGEMLVIPVVHVLMSGVS